MKTYKHSFFPGPSSVPDNILQTGLIDYGSADTEPEFLNLYIDCINNIKKIFNTKSDVVIMTGEGMLALWSGLKSCLKKEDKVLSISTGMFGTGIADMAKAIGCNVKLIQFPSNCSFENYELIEKAIAKFKPKMVTAVHCETPSGILNDLSVIGKMKKKYKVPILYIDAVSSVGATHVNVDENNIDICLGGSQKALSCPPNSCFLTVSKNAWKIVKKINYQGYDALLPFKDVIKTGYFPYTQSWMNVAQLYQATQNILEEGLNNVVQRHYACAQKVRDILKNNGFKLFPCDEKYSSPTVTAAYIPPNYSWEEFDAMMRKKGIVFGSNYEDLKGKVFRIGHMGTQTNTDFLLF